MDHDPRKFTQADVDAANARALLGRRRNVSVDPHQSQSPRAQRAVREQPLEEVADEGGEPEVVPAGAPGTEGVEPATTAIVHRQNKEVSEEDSPECAQPDNPKYFIKITDYRQRLLDRDGACPKYVIDCLRYAGIIENDRYGDVDYKVHQVRVKEEKDIRTEITVLRLR